MHGRCGLRLYLPSNHHPNETKKNVDSHSSGWGQYRKGAGGLVNLLTEPVLSKTGNDWLVWKDDEDLEWRCSDQEIQLRTNDPVNCPLPNHDLLELRWILNRVVAMSGELS